MSSLRLIDSWTEGAFHKTEWRRVEDADGERLECRGEYDADFHAPKHGKALSLALRLLQLQRDGALPVGREAREREEMERNVIDFRKEETG